MSDALPAVRRALERRLIALLPDLGAGIEVAFENASISPAGTYLEPRLLPADPDGSFYGSLTYLERGVFQVAIMSPLGKGAGSSEALGAKIRKHFARGTTLTENGIQTIVVDVPSQSRGFPDQGSWRTPVSIPWEALVAV
jgi:hypothetical protein